MAKYKIPGQDLEFDIPDDGEVFKLSKNIDPTGSGVFKRQGNELINLDINEVSNQAGLEKYYSKYGANITYGGTAKGYETKPGQSVDAGTRSQVARDYLKEQGVDLDTIQEKNYIDLTAVFGAQPGFTKRNAGGDFSIFKPAPVKTGEVITETISPINKDAPVIKSNTGETIFENKNTAEQNQNKAIEVNKTTTIAPAAKDGIQKSELYPNYSFKVLPNGNIDILENGVSLNSGANFNPNYPGFSPTYAATLGYKATGSTAMGEPTKFDPQTEIANYNAVANTDQNKIIQDLAKTFKTTDITTSESSKISKALADIVSGLSTENTTVSKSKSLTQTLADKRAEFGVGELETSLGNIDSQLAELESDYTTLFGEESNRKVSTATINRRKSKEQTAYETAKRDLVAEKNTITNQLNQKYSVIDSFVKYAGMDIDNAQQEYQNKFNQALNVAQLLSNEENREQTIKDKQTDNARANVQVMLTALKGKDFSTFDSTTLNDIRTLELNAGLPAGFMKTIASAIPDPVISIGSEFTDDFGQRVVPIYTKNPQTGVVTAKTLSLGGAQATSGEKYTSGGMSIPKSDLSVISAGLEKARGTDGWTDPNLFKTLYNTWVNEGGLGKDFLTNFPPKSYINPANTDLPAALQYKNDAGF